MNSKDEMNRASEHLDRARDHAVDATEHGRAAARESKQAMEAGASGTLERAKEKVRDVGSTLEHATERASERARQAGERVGSVADSVRHAEPDRDLEQRAGSAGERAVGGTGESLKGAAPTVRRGVEATIGAAGATVHVLAGPLGTIVGKIAGRIGGWWNSAREAIRELPEEDEARFRTRFESYPDRPATLSYDTARTAYALGYVAAKNPDYREREFDDVEPDLRHGFGEHDEESYRALRDFTRYGYEHVSTIRPTGGENRSGD